MKTAKYMTLKNFVHNYTVYLANIQLDKGYWTQDMHVAICLVLLPMTATSARIPNILRPFNHTNPVKPISNYSSLWFNHTVFLSTTLQHNAFALWLLYAHTWRSNFLLKVDKN